MDPAKERRRHPRLRLDGTMPGRATVLTDVRVVALSESGACLATTLPMALGSDCDLTLNLSHGSLDLKGRVVDVRPDEAEGPFLVGVDFRNVEPEEQGLLLSFLESARRRSP